MYNWIRFIFVFTSMFFCVLFHIYKDCVLLLHSESIVEVHVLAKEVIPEAKKFLSNTS